MSELFLTLKQVAKLLKVPAGRIYSMLFFEEIEAPKKHGKSYVFTEEDVVRTARRLGKTYHIGGKNETDG